MGAPKWRGMSGNLMLLAQPLILGRVALCFLAIGASPVTLSAMAGAALGN